MYYFLFFSDDNGDSTVTERLYIVISASGDSVDATQELLTLGICNLLGSFSSSFPVTGSFSRSAVNHASGVMTPFGGFYTGKS